MECEWYARTAHDEPVPCKRTATIVLRCLDTTAEGPDREARFEWVVCDEHAHELSDEYSSGDVVIESEEPVV